MTFSGSHDSWWLMINKYVLNPVTDSSELGKLTRLKGLITLAIDCISNVL
jgi:hypothetical protein